MILSDISVTRPVLATVLSLLLVAFDRLPLREYPDIDPPVVSIETVYPGAETRTVIGTVILAGVLAATLFTLFVVPVAYDLLARHTGSPSDVKRRLEREMAAEKG